MVNLTTHIIPQSKSTEIRVVLIEDGSVLDIMSVNVTGEKSTWVEQSTLLIREIHTQYNEALASQLVKAIEAA